MMHPKTVLPAPACPGRQPGPGGLRQLDERLAARLSGATSAAAVNINVGYVAYADDAALFLGSRTGSSPSTG